MGAVLADVPATAILNGNLAKNAPVFTHGLAFPALQMQRLEPDSDDSASEAEEPRARSGPESVSSLLLKLTSSCTEHQLSHLDQLAFCMANSLTHASQRSQAHVGMSFSRCLIFGLSRKARVMLVGTKVTTMKMMMALLMTQKCMNSLEVTGTNQSTLASTSTR